MAPGEAVGLVDRKPSGCLKALLDAPALLYRARLGWLLGRRFLLLVHRGRESGKRRETVLEVARYDPATREAAVISAWGERADWYRNLAAAPALEVRIGRERYVPRQRFLDEVETLALLRDYRRAHPRAFRELSRFFGLPPVETAVDEERLEARVRGVAFRPPPGRVDRAAEPARAGRRTYDTLAPWYDLLAEPTERRARRAGLALLRPRQGETILEIGYGTGRAIVALARAVGASGRVVGIDLSTRMHGVAARRVARAGLAGRVELRVHDAVAVPLPFGDATVDAIFLAFTLELFETSDIPRLLAECHRVLRDGGRLCTVSLSRRDPDSLPTRLYERAHARFPCWLDCRPIDAAAELAAAGLRVAARRELAVAGLPIDAVLAIAKPPAPRS